MYFISICISPPVVLNGEQQTINTRGRHIFRITINCCSFKDISTMYELRSIENNIADVTICHCCY